MAITDDQGTVVRDYQYDVFGEVVGGSGSVESEFQFAGEQVDGSTGLQYLRNRYYDMETGRFISRDPLSSMPGWVEHPYMYASANPCTLTDPLGLAPSTPFGSGAREQCQELWNGITKEVETLKLRKQQWEEDTWGLEARSRGRSRRGEARAYADHQLRLRDLLSSFRSLHCETNRGRVPVDFDPDALREADHLAGEYRPLERRSVLDGVKNWLDNLPEPPDVWWSDGFWPWPWPNRVPVRP